MVYEHCGPKQGQGTSQASQVHCGERLSQSQVWPCVGLEFYRYHDVFHSLSLSEKLRHSTKSQSEINEVLIFTP